MAVSLAKGEKISLTKHAPQMQHLILGLGWDTQQYDGSLDFDLDGSVFALGGNGKVLSDADFIFYNNKIGAQKAIEHCGDNRTGEGEGDDEQVHVHLDKMPSSYEKVIFAVTIHEAKERKQNFGQIRNAYIRILNADTNQEEIRFDLSEDYSIETAMVFGELYKHGNEWKFAAIGQGFEGGLLQVAQKYGVNIG